MSVCILNVIRNRGHLLWSIAKDQNDTDGIRIHRLLITAEMLFQQKQILLQKKQFCTLCFRKILSALK